MLAIRQIVLILLVVLLIVAPADASLAASAVRMPLLGRRIMIDPGHGGDDPGACRAGLAEEDIVLDLAFQLRDLLTACGADVRLTREADIDLADLIPIELARSRKRRDIMGRVKLSNDWQPDLLLSLHVNAIPSSRWRGAQVFYQQQSEQSPELANALQRAMIKVLGNTNRQAKPGDYRILNDAEALSALLEIGFISNPEEAQLLNSVAYRRQIAWSILIGLLDWYGNPVAHSPTIGGGYYPVNLD